MLVLVSSDFIYDCTRESVQYGQMFKGVLPVMLQNSIDSFYRSTMYVMMRKVYDGSATDDYIDMSEWSKGTLFDKQLYPRTANYLHQFVEGCITGMMWPTLHMCPSMKQIGDFAGSELDDENWQANLDAFLDVANKNAEKTGNCDVFPWIRAEATTTNTEEKRRQRLTIWHHHELTSYNSGTMPEHRVKVLDNIRFFERYHRGKELKKKNMDNWSVNYQDLRSLVNELKCKAAMKRGELEREHQVHNTTVKVKVWPLKEHRTYRVGSRPHKLASWCRNQFRRLTKAGRVTSETFASGKLRAEYQHQVDLLREIGMPGSDRLG